jgi:maltose/moltooligosaccharide transporter
LIGAPIGALAFGVIPLAAVLPIFVASTITLILSMALWRTPVVALMPDVTPSKYRSQANGIINFMGGVGAIISFLGGAALYRLNPAFPFWLGSGLVVVAALLVFIFVREPKEFRRTTKASVIDPAQQQEKQPSLLDALQQLIKDKEKSALYILLAIFFWFVAYNAIEAFFTLYANRHLGMEEAAGPALLGQLSLLFVLFALPAGLIGGKIGRRLTIMSGIVILMLAMLAMYVLPANTLVIQLTRLPVLGVVPVVGLVMMFAGIGWALININSLPMVVDMTNSTRIGTFTGLYYLFSGLAAVAGPNINGVIVQLTGEDYSKVMLIGPIFMLMALVSMFFVRRGEASEPVPLIPVEG